MLCGTAFSNGPIAGPLDRWGTGMVVAIVVVIVVIEVIVVVVVIWYW